MLRTWGAAGCAPTLLERCDWGEMKTYRVAVIAGDGIGKEVVPEGIRVVDAAGARF